MKYNFKIKGLDCANCAAELERAIQKIEGVDSASISFMTEKMIIECNEEEKNEMCVCDIANVLNMSKSSISHQLGTLRRSGIVKCRKIGKEVFYALDDEHVKEVFEVGIKHIDHKR